MKTIEEFIKYLEGFSRGNCPKEFYQAWKILVMKTSEYREANTEFEHLHFQFNRFRMGIKSCDYTRGESC